MSDRRETVQDKEEHMKDTTKKPYTVKVTLVAETEVEITVWATDDEDPADLTPDERQKAVSLAAITSDWEIQSVKVVESP